MTPEQEAAAAWGGQNLRLIRNRENAVYEMQLRGGGRAALRLHRMGYQGAAAIRSELWWCAELARAGVSVPAPLPNAEGGLLLQLSNGRYASAIEWVPGDPLGEAGQPFPDSLPELQSRHYALGRLVARFIVRPTP